MSTSEVLGYLNSILILGAAFYIRNYLSSYVDQKAKNLATKEDIFEISVESERGKNLATKEDIGHITAIVELIKAQHAAELETLKSRNQLRVASIDQRLRAHQEAFTLWRRLYGAVQQGDIGQIVQECQHWWDNNCLYLEPEAARAASRVDSEHPTQPGDGMTIKQLICLNVLTLLSPLVFGQDAPTGQWKHSPLSMRELVDKGYSIVSVIDSTKTGGPDIMTFYLQKPGSIYSCLELHVGDFKKGKREAMFDCLELVQPYTVPLKR